MKKIQEKVNLYIRQHRLLQDKARVVVGLSGGPDSICLAIILQELGYEVIAVHCNFHLRGEESMRDEHFVQTFCEQRNIRFFKVDFDTQEYAREKKISIEMAARELRYNEFRAYKHKMAAAAIAVGHHEDDNAETLILNLARGTGIKGLCGMQPKNEDIIRPLLCLKRQEILIYLAEKHQDYVTDHTNLEKEFARNKVRLSILPVMEEINSGATKNIASAIENLNEVQKVYLQSIKEAQEKCCKLHENGELHINIQKLMGTPSPISVLHETLSPLGFNKTQIKEMLATRDDSGRIFQGKERRLLVDRQAFIVESEQYPDAEISQQSSNVEGIKIEKNRNIAYLDAGKLKGELTIRTPKEGDTFSPFGMKGKRKLLSDFLTDQKLSLFEKERQLLLMDGEEIAWVAGRRSSELYRVDETTQQVIILHLKTSQR